MALYAPKTETTFELQPEGTHVARVVSLIQLGTHMEEYMGAPKKFNKIRITFELPTELRTFKEEEQPMVISNDYTLSMSEKANLRKIVEGIIGKSMVDGEADMFDLESLVGKACLLTIKHKTSTSGKTYANISTASPLVKGMTAPEQVNPSKILTFENFDNTVFNSLPDFIKEKITTSEEYQNMQSGTDLVGNWEEEPILTEEEMDAINA